MIHINRRDRKMKGQGPKTGSGSTNQPRGGSFWALGLLPRISSLCLRVLWCPILALNPSDLLRKVVGAGSCQPVSTSSLLSCRSGGWPLRHPRQLRQIPPLSSRLPLYFHRFVILWRPSAGVGLINALWGQTALSPARWVRAVGCNEPFRIPLYEQLRDCRSQSLYWVSYL